MTAAAMRSPHSQRLPVRERDLARDVAELIFFQRFSSACLLGVYFTRAAKELPNSPAVGILDL